MFCFGSSEWETDHMKGEIIFFERIGGILLHSNYTKKQTNTWASVNE